MFVVDWTLFVVDWTRSGAKGATASQAQPPGLWYVPAQKKNKYIWLKSYVGTTIALVPARGDCVTRRIDELGMRATQTIYRGFCIYTFGKDSFWSVSASPLTPDLPIFSRYSFVSEGDTETLAIAEAKNRIDRLLASQA